MATQARDTAAATLYGRREPGEVPLVERGGVDARHDLGWPDPDSPLWTPELRWLLDRGPAWRHLYVYAYLALVDVVTGYHRGHGIADAVSWMTLADLGRNLAIDRRMRREGWTPTSSCCGSCSAP